VEEAAVCYRADLELAGISAEIIAINKIRLREFGV
jgi:hypothetical protein